MYVSFIQLIKNEKNRFLKIFLKVLIQCQNVRMKAFDSSLTKVNKLMNKHLV
jgi:hypothetical protein